MSRVPDRNEHDTLGKLQVSILQTKNSERKGWWWGQGAGVCSLQSRVQCAEK